MRRAYFLIVVASLTQGCSGSAGTTSGIKAKRFFSDPKVIELCLAIESNDRSKVELLIKQGVDVNALGRGNTSPLFWAFANNNLGVFEQLLEYGADPNIIMTTAVWDLLESERGWVMADLAVTHYACITQKPGFFEAVFAHRGDPNLVAFRNNDGVGRTPIFLVIEWNARDKPEKAKQLIKIGADINHTIGGGMTPVMIALGAHRCELNVALELLKAGADFKRSYYDGRYRLVHELAVRATVNKGWNAVERANYLDLVKWLEDHGESIDAAQADLQQWRMEAAQPSQATPSVFK